MKTNPIRVLIVDDHYMVRIGLAAILDFEPAISVVGQAADGLEAIELFRQHQPDITLMDVRMPQLGGMETMAILRKEFPAARILMLTTFDGDEEIYRAMQGGARGYLLKSVPADELVAAISVVHAGEIYLPSCVAQRLAERNAGSALTDRELEVLELLAKGFSNREIGRILGFTENTAKYHLKGILSKLEVSDRTEAATAALQRGYLH